MATLKQRPLLLMTALAALLRLPTLAVESLWHDEAFTAWVSTLDFAKLFSAALDTVHPPTWYLIEWTVAHALGSSVFSLRLVPALAGIALVPAVWRLTGDLGLDRAAQGAAALATAIAPFAVYYSQEARSYSLLYLLLTLAAIAMLEQRWPWFILAATFALYLHNLACLPLAALLWLGLYRQWRNRWLYLSFGLIGLAWLPWIIWGLISQASAVSAGYWINPPAYGAPFFVLTALFWSEKALLLFPVTVPLLALALFWSRPKLELLALLLIPLGLAVIISALIAPILITRVVGWSAVPLYLILGPSLFPARPGSTAAAAPIICFGLVLVIFYAAYWGSDRIGRPDWPRPNVVINPTDGIFHANQATYIVWHYYLPKNDQAVWRQTNSLSQGSLTDKTKEAMGMNQARFEEVACKYRYWWLAHRRWWLAFYETPTTGQAERSEMARIVQKYHGQETVMFKNQLVNARLYLLQNTCPGVR